LNDDENDRNKLNSSINSMRFENKSSPISFEVISSNSSNKIRLQQIFKLNDVYNATVLVNYCVEGALISLNS